MPYRDEAERKKYHAQYYKKHKAKISKQNADYRRRNSVALKKKAAEWRAKNKDYTKRKNADFYPAYYCANKERIQAGRRAEYHQRKQVDPEAHERAVRKHHLQSKYGMTIDDYERLRKKQKDRCAVCGGVMKFSGPLYADRAVIDHDHESGQVRGILHNRCNLLLGNFKDDVKILRSAIKYLTSSAKK